MNVIRYQDSTMLVEGKDKRPGGGAWHVLGKARGGVWLKYARERRSELGDGGRVLKIAGPLNLP
jgi:hypothetical protein